MSTTTAASFRLVSRTLYGSEQRAFWSLLSIMIALVGLYIYFISMSVMNVVLREEMLLEITAAHSNVGEMEAVYLTKKNAIDAQYATTLGFQPIEKKHFVTRGAGTLTLNR